MSTTNLKSFEDNCELNLKQSIIMLKGICYLRIAYFNIFRSDLKGPISFNMMDCADFKEEKLALEVRLQELSSKSHNNQRIDLLVYPKGHCELAGEGVEYAWGLMK